MIVDLKNSSVQGGLGDAVMFSFFEGIQWHCKDHQRQVFELFGRETVDSGGISIEQSYLDEIKDHGRQSRLAYVQACLPKPVEIKRPVATFTDQEIRLARFRCDRIGRPTCILFPRANKAERCYPVNKWLDVTEGLRAKDITCIWLDTEEMPDVYKFQGLPIREIAAMVSEADMVLGCESFGCCLGGVFDKPTTVVIGPSNPTCTQVFSSWNHVQGGSCSGCHWSKPFRPACRYGCAPLQEINAQQVIDSVVKLWSGRYLRCL